MKLIPPESLEKELSGDISFILLRQLEVGQIQGERMQDQAEDRADRSRWSDTGTKLYLVMV